MLDRHREQVGDAIGDGGVHDLALAAGPCVGECRQHAGDEVHRSAGEVTEQVERDLRGSACSADRVERAGDRDVVDVVPSGLGQWSVLTPARHPAVDQLAGCGRGTLGAEAETLGDAGAETLDQDVGLLDEVEDDLDAARILEVDRHRWTAAREDVLLGDRHLHGVAAGTIDANDVSAEIGEQHAGERTGPDADELDDAYAGEWAGGLEVVTDAIVTVLLSRFK